MTTPAPFAVNDCDGNNTRIHYKLVAADSLGVTDPETGITPVIPGKLLAEGDVIVTGRITVEDIETIRTNSAFDPDDAGVPSLEELMPLSWTPRGDERHEITKISFTNNRPTPHMPDAGQFAYAFEPAAPAMSMQFS